MLQYQGYFISAAAASAATNAVALKSEAAVAVVSKKTVTIGTRKTVLAGPKKEVPTVSKATWSKTKEGRIS